MTPRDAYIRMTPWSRRLVDRGYCWALPPAYVLLLPLGILAKTLVWLYEAVILLSVIVGREMPRDIADEWRVMRLGSRYRRDAEPGDPNG
jgi:hypothetical protein